MSHRNGRYISAFEAAALNLRQLLAHFYRDLKMPADTIRMQVDGVLTSFAVQEAYEQENQRPPDGPA